MLFSKRFDFAPIVIFNAFKKGVFLNLFTNLYASNRRRMSGRRHSSCDISDLESSLKRHRLSDTCRGYATLAVWRYSQQSLVRALTPHWVGIAESRSRERAASDLSVCETEPGDISQSNSNSAMNSDDSISLSKSKRKIRSISATLQPAEWKENKRESSSDNLFEVDSLRYHDVGLLLTLGQGNSLLSSLDQREGLSNSASNQLNFTHGPSDLQDTSCI